MSETPFQNISVIEDGVVRADRAISPVDPVLPPPSIIAIHVTADRVNEYRVRRHGPILPDDREVEGTRTFQEEGKSAVVSARIRLERDAPTPARDFQPEMDILT